MFKRILIPTDGARVARKAIAGGVKLARELGASVIRYNASEPVEGFYYEGGDRRLSQRKTLEEPRKHKRCVT